MNIKQKFQDNSYKFTPKDFQYFVSYPKMLRLFLAELQYTYRSQLTKYGKPVKELTFGEMVAHFYFIMREAGKLNFDFGDFKEFR